jgi:hypothetical protein
VANVQAGESLEHGGIRFSTDLIAELDRGRSVIRIPREDVRRIALCWGFQAPRPFVQAVLGIGLLLAGIYILVRIIMELMAHGGQVVGRLLIGLVIVGLLGGWLLFEAFKRGYYLEVRTEKRTEKLRFNRRLSRAEIEEFVASVRSQMGWIIDTPSYEEAGQGGSSRIR